MTLQERILEVLAEHALTPKALYKSLSTELPSAVDFALRGLLKAGEVTLSLGHYQRPKAAPAALPALPGRRPGRPPKVALPEEAIATIPRAAPVMPAGRRCVRCKRRKPLEEFPIYSPTTGAHLRTCNDCVGLEAAAVQRIEITGSDGGPLAAVIAETPPRITFSADLTAWLIESQRRHAEELQKLLLEASLKQEELAYTELLVRMATGRQSG